jgi:penicillin-binding protein 1C
MGADSKSPYRNKFFQKVSAQKLWRLVKRLTIVAAASFLLFLLLNVFFPLADNVDYSVMITDAEGKVINGYLTKDEKWRMKTELNEISPLLRQTIIAKEDQYFYHHPGINPLAVARALIKNISRQKTISGASTITMQVARALEKRERNLFSKILETFRAFQLEWKYSKDEILQLYLNLVPYGSNIEGVKAASLLYFNKAPDHLSLAEITALSIIPNRPSSLVIGRNNDRIVQERNRWLHKFADDKVFTPKQIEDALSEPLTAIRGSVPHIAPHLSLQLKKTATQHEVKTNLVTNTQLKIEKLTEDYVRGLRDKGIRNASVIVVDNRTNAVIAYVGSASFTDTMDAGQVNGAAAVRQPGSTLKPLLYALCMDEGLLTPKMMLNDVAVSYDGYAPENYDKNFNGAVTMEYALEHSLNIPSVKSLRQLGKDQFVNKLIAVDFRQINKDQRKLGLSMILGGCGATLEELTGLFAAFAHEGRFAPLKFTKDTTSSSSTQLIAPASSYLITDILSKVNRPDFPLNWTATEHMPRIAWKTGTSYGRRDAWSIGYNKNYTVGIWVGNFSGARVPELSGANTATPLLFKVFNTIDYNSDAGWYVPPKDLALRQVCQATGLPPGEHCTNLISDYFIPLVSSNQLCRHVQEIQLSADGKWSYCQSCVPETGYTKQWVSVMAPELEQWYEERSLAYEKVPPHYFGCEKIFRGSGPSITSPRNGAEYFINTNEPEPLQLAAHAGADVSRLYWYIDDVLYKTTLPGEKQFFTPKEGSVKISCTDDKGRNTNIRIVVKHVRL